MSLPIDPSSSLFPITPSRNDDGVSSVVRSRVRRKYERERKTFVHWLGGFNRCEHLERLDRRRTPDRISHHVDLILVHIYQKTWHVYTAKDRASLQMNRVCGAVVWPVGVVNNVQLLM